MRQIEWIGQPSLFSDPRVEFAMARGQYSEEQLRVLRAAAKQRIPRIDGRSIRLLDPQAVPGLSKSYQWGPGSASYVIPVTDNDARAIFACSSGAEFRDVTNGVPAIIVGDTRIDQTSLSGVTLNHRG